MRYRPINPQLFVQNRANLAQLLLPNSLAVVNANDLLPPNADGTLPLRQNSDLFYLTGIDQEETILLLYPDAHDEKMREILFVRETNELLATWEGHKLTKEEAKKISGIKRVEWLSEFRPLFHRLMCECEHVYLNSNEHKPRRHRGRDPRRPVHPGHPGALSAARLPAAGAADAPAAQREVGGWKSSCSDRPAPLPGPASSGSAASSSRA